MSQSSPELDSIVREFLDLTKREEDAQIFGLLFQYLGHLYEENEDPILLEDLSAYEIDDYLQFFLQDNFPEEFLELQRKSIPVLKNFRKFLSDKKLLEKEDEKEWKEVLK